jgi:hypothetical protein
MTVETPVESRMVRIDGAWRYAVIMLLRSLLLVALPLSAASAIVFAPPVTPPSAAAPSPQRPDAEQGFEPIFNGKDLAGWVGERGSKEIRGYAVEDGAIVCLPEGRNLYTEREYGDFVLRFEFKLEPGSNNGIGIRTPLEGDPAYVGMEVQVLDDSAPQYATLKPWQYHGSIYGIAAAKRGHLKPVGEWNAQEITVDGTKIRVELNGTVIVDVDVAEHVRATDPKPTLDGQDHPGLRRAKGHIAFCGHGDRVAYRNIRVRPLR